MAGHRRALLRRWIHTTVTHRAPMVRGSWTDLLVMTDVQTSILSRALLATADPWHTTPRNFHYGLLYTPGDLVPIEKVELPQILNHLVKSQLALPGFSVGKRIGHLQK